MSKTIGIIAEDNSDIEVIVEILAKYLERNAFSVKHFVGNGCGKLMQKCGSWADTLTKRGCDHILLFHDLDRNSEAELRKRLVAKIAPSGLERSIIVIPTEELEAWLLSDVEAIKKTFSLKKLPKRIANCEVVKSPKEHLAALVWSSDRKQYMNTVHNRRISQYTSLENLRRCSSFAAFDQYVTDNFLAVEA
jgi:hypothetical protein